MSHLGLPWSPLGFPGPLLGFPGPPLGPPGPVCGVRGVRGVRVCVCVFGVCVVRGVRGAKMAPKIGKKGGGGFFPRPVFTAIYSIFEVFAENLEAPKK